MRINSLATATTMRELISIHTITSAATEMITPAVIASRAPQIAVERVRDLVG